MRCDLFPKPDAELSSFVWEIVRGEIGRVPATQTGADGPSRSADAPDIGLAGGPGLLN